MIALLLGGCVTHLEPGAERVMVVQSESAVQGCTLIDSWSGSTGGAWEYELPVLAQNYGRRQGADLVLLRTTPGRSMTAFTMEAYRRGR